MRLIPRRPNRLLARDFKTERLWLRSYGPVRTVLLSLPWRHDADLMARLAFRSEPLSFWRWLRLISRPNNVTRFVYAIFPMASTRPVGMISVHLYGDGEAASHIVIADPAWRGQQISIEARALLMTHFFAHADVDRFTARTDTRNMGSVFVYQRLGFRNAGIIADGGIDRVTGRRIERIAFVLTRAEWENRPRPSTPPLSPSGDHP